jgi:hypothetical protein
LAKKYRVDQDIRFLAAGTFFLAVGETINPPAAFTTVI